MNRLLVFIFILGLLLRLINLSHLPADINRDEAAIGYNAFSILKTQKDEHNQYLPLVFKSFGDYKLPGLIYLNIIPVKLFGLNPFSVRIINALSGSLLILVVYFLTQELTKSSKIPIIASFLTSVAMFHVHGSRSAYEPIVALTLSTAAILFMFKSIKKPLVFFHVTWLFLLSFYFYNAPMILCLPLVLVFFVYYRQQLTRIHSWGLVLLVLGMIITYQTTFSLISLKLHTTFFDLINQPFAFISLFIKQYLTAFNPIYLFFTGDDNPWHNLAHLHLGNLNPFLLPFFLFGLKTAPRILILFLLVFPLANALSLDAPVTNRLMDFHLIILLISSFGIDYLFQSYPKLAKIFFSGFIIILIYFLISYFFFHSNHLAGFWQHRLNQAITELEKIKTNYSKVFITDQIDSGYIYYLFHTQFDPAIFQKNAQWSSDGGLVYVTKLNNLHFGKVPYEFSLFPIHENLQVIGDYLQDPPHQILVLDKVDQLIPNANYQFIIKDEFNQPLWAAKQISL